MSQNRLADLPNDGTPIPAMSFTSAERDFLVALLSSDNPPDRQRALSILEPSLKETENFDFARSVLASCVRDTDRDVQADALQLVSYCIRDDPEWVWSITESLASGEDATTRSYVAAYILEHLLDLDFEAYFPRIEHSIQAGQTNWLDTLRLCLRLKATDVQWARVLAILEAHGYDYPFSA